MAFGYFKVSNDFAEVENGMNSTERLHYYGTHLEEEAPLHTVEVRPTWPEKGEILFNNVEMRYRYVLLCLNFECLTSNIEQLRVKIEAIL